MIRNILTITNFLIAIYSFAQTQANIKFSHISIEQGLSQSVVFDIFQDRDGLLWFGTQDGLNKFDGYKFTIYQNDPKDVISKDNYYKSLSNNSVRSICEDKNGTLWIGTESGGLNKYDKYIDKFTVYSNDPNDPYSLSSNEIRTVYEDAAGTIWIGTFGGGLNKLDKKTGKFTIYKNIKNDPRSLSNNNVMAIWEDRSGILWIGTNGGGLNVLDRKSGKFKSIINNPNDAQSLSSNNILSIYEDRSGNIWIGTDGGGINKIDKKSGKITIYKNIPEDIQSLSNNTVWAIMEDNAGTIWVGTFGGGLNKLDKQSGKFIVFKNEQLDGQSLSNNFIYSLFQDKSGTIWIGNYGGGLNKFDKNTGKFAVYRRNPSVIVNQEKQLPCLSSNAIRSVMVDKSGLLWIGTRGGGLNMYDKTTGVYTIFKNDPNDINSISNNAVYSILEDNSGTIWVGTFGGGLNKFDRETGKFIVFKNNPQDPKSISSNAIRVIKEDKSGSLWIGTDGGGLNKFDKVSEEFTVYKNDPEKADNVAITKNGNLQSLSNNAVYSIYIASDETIWIGTDGGLNKFDKRSGKFFVYKTNPIDPYSLSNNSVYSILEDKNGIIWIGTDGGGLNKMIKIKDNSPHKFLSKWKNFSINENEDSEIINFKSYTIYEGLPNNCIYSIVEDGKGNLWLTTNKGLCKFTPLSITSENKKNSGTALIRNYDTYDGLPSNEFNLGANFKCKNGILYFGSINGLISFHPDSIIDDTIKPPVIITNFLLFNKEVDILPIENIINKGDSLKGRIIHINENSFIPQSISYSKNLTLSYNDKVFTFEFAALHYSVPGKNQYAYKMEGFDKDWNYVGTRRYASYTNLSPGDYTFRVKASNCDGIWNETGVSIKITILPPFWQTWWFRSLIALSVISIISIYIKWRERKLKRDKLILEATVKERTEQLSEANEELNLQNEEISAQRDNLQSFNTELQHKNQEIEEQRDKIQEQKSQIELKNINITASITYAKRIQSAILPPQELINKLIPDSFILYKPKSIVSGDFYWLDYYDQYIYIAVVDCTGHGVPGALMSVVGYNMLNQAIKEKQIYNPANIINFLGNNLSQTLRQTETDTSLRDGMDLIICRINKLSLAMEFAGAHCPVYLIRDGQLIEYKTEKFSIGLPFNDKFTGFTSQKIDLKKNDIIYLFTDGYIDQFGGPENKKIMAKQFRELITQVAEKPMYIQKNILDDFIESWRNNFKTENDQTDDITVLGVRI